MLFTPLCNPKTGESVCGKETRAIVSKFDNLSEDGGGVVILGGQLLVLGPAMKWLKPLKLYYCCVQMIHCQALELEDSGCVAILLQ